jgi:lipopolysaccharide export system permease protein
MDNATLYMRLNLYAGVSYEELPPDRNNPQQLRFARVKFDSTYAKLDMSGLGLQRTDETFFRGHRYMLSVPQLAEAVDSIAVLIPAVIKDLNEQAGTHIRPYQRLQDSTATLEPLTTPAPDTVRYALDYFAKSAQVAILARAQNSVRAMGSFLEFGTSRWIRENQEYNKYLGELHTKFALPIACIIFLFIGAPIGAIVRKGGIGMPVVVSVLFFILLYALMTQGKKMSQDGVAAVWFGIWLPIVVLFPIALYLTYQSAQDARLFDISSYRLFWERFKQKLRQKV